MTDETAAVVKTRFVQIPEWVVRHPLIKKHAQCLQVYCSLALMADFRSRVTTSDWREVVTDTGLSRAQVMRQMATLREVQAIVRRDDEIVLPMDQPGQPQTPPGRKNETHPDPGRKNETDRSQKRDDSVSHLRPSPSYSENSELLSEDSAANAAGKTPVDRCAHRLTVLAFERETKPGPKFTAVLGVVKSTLRAGWSDQQIETVIRTHAHVGWTVAGLRAELEAEERASRKNGNGKPPTEIEMIADERARYQAEQQQALAEGRLV